MSVVKKLFREIAKCKNPAKWLRKHGATVGNNVKITYPFYCGSELDKLTIGDQSHFSSYVAFVFHDGSNVVPEQLRMSAPGVRKTLPITIGKNCFIGMRAMFLPGSGIGDNCIVAAGSVVTKRFPDNCVLGGVPAKVIETLGAYLEKNASYLKLDPDTDFQKYK